jgi:ribokinase
LDALGDRIVFALPGASLIESPEDLDLAYVSLGRVLYIGPAYPEVASAAAVAARQAGALVLYAPSGAWGDDRLEGIRPILQVADLLLVSRTEAAALTGQTSPEEAIQRLGETGLPAVIETLGPQGALVRTEEGVTHVPAFSVTRVRDTTGAGDAFAAGLVAGFLQGMSWPASARLGSAVAALKIQHIGARRGLPARGEAMGLLTSTPLSALDGS